MQLCNQIPSESCEKLGQQTSRTVGGVSMHWVALPDPLGQNLEGTAIWSGHSPVVPFVVALAVVRLGQRVKCIVGSLG